MEHKIWYDTKDDILHQKIIGLYSTKESIDSGAMYVEQLEGKHYRQMVVDLSTAGKMESRDTRSKTNEQLNNAKITDVAFVGANAATRMIAKVLMKLGSLNANSTFVGTVDEAIKWIKNRR